MTSDALLRIRSRYGDRSASRRLAERHLAERHLSQPLLAQPLLAQPLLAERPLERIAQLASVVGGTPQRSAELAAQGYALALRRRRLHEEDALLSAFGRLAALEPDPEAARGRLLLLLVEVEHRPVDQVARLLGLDSDRTPALIRSARSELGLSHPGRTCRGWGLVARRGLTAAERDAAQGHLALCRRCRERFDVLERTRARLLGGSAGATTAVAVTQLATLGTAATASAVGVGGLAGTKLGAGLVAAAGAAVLTTAGTTAVVVQLPDTPRPAHAPAAVAPTPSVPRPSTSSAATPTPTSTLLPGVPSYRLPTDPRAPLVPAPRLPLATVLPTPPVPPLPTVLPLPTAPALPSLPSLPSLLP